MSHNNMLGAAFFLVSIIALVKFVHSVKENSVHTLYISAMIGWHALASGVQHAVTDTAFRGQKYLDRWKDRQLEF